MADFHSVKMEEDVKVKLESDQISMADDDEFEDTGELQFPPKRQPSQINDGIPQVWLLRTPKDVWDGIKNLKSDKPIQLGAIHTWGNTANVAPKMILKIRKDLPESFKLIAKDYDLQDLPEVPHNTFVFSEKDLPGYKPNSFRRFGGPARKPDSGKIQKRPPGPRSITKHTAYIDKPNVEVHCSPRETGEWFAIQEEKARIERDKKKDTQMYNINQARVIMTAGQQGANFIKGIEVKKARPQDNKYQRLEEGVLIQQILIAFGEFRWWSLKTLNERLKQPEAHLRDVLQKVAVLVKSGDAANKWQLNANTQALIDYDGSKAGFGGEDKDDDDDDEDEDDDDDEEMEDVDV